MLVSRRNRTIAIAAAVVVLVAAVASVMIFRHPAQAESSASLTIFVGSVQVQHAGTSTSTVAATGEQIHQGDSLTAGPTTKASLDFPNGAVTRIDSGTQLTVTTLARTTSGGYNTELSQASGQTWNKITQLVGSSFKMKGPNNSTAEVRGTTFKWVTTTTTATLDTYDGAVLLKVANAPELLVSAGEESSTTNGAPPTPSKPIPPADKFDPFTVFNKGADSAPPGSKLTQINSSTLSQGQSTAPAGAAGADGKHDLTITVSWPGSSFGATITGPDGKVLGSGSSATPPLSVTGPKAPAGSTYTVTCLECQPNEPYSVIVSSAPAKATPSPSPTATPTPAPPVTSPSTPAPTDPPIPTPAPSASVAPAATIAPTPAPTGTPTPAAPTPVPSTSPTAVATPTPSASPSASPSPSPSPSLAPTPPPVIYVPPPSSPPPSTVIATVNSVSPNSGPPGSTITINGSHFNGATAVLFDRAALTQPHSGNNSLQLQWSSYVQDAGGASFVSQPVIVPTGAARLGFNYKLFCFDGTIYDYLYVDLTTAAGSNRVWGPRCEEEVQQAWQTATVDLASYAGQAATLTFGMAGDYFSSPDTSFAFLDDVSLSGDSGEAITNGGFESGLSGWSTGAATLGYSSQGSFAPRIAYGFVQTSDTTISAVVPARDPGGLASPHVYVVNTQWYYGGQTTAPSFTYSTGAGSPARLSLVLAPSGPITAGVPFTLGVQVADQNGNVVPASSGITFASSDAGVGTSLPAPYTYTSGDGGQHQFGFTLSTLGAQTITVSGPGLTPASFRAVVTRPRLTFVTSSPAASGIAFPVTLRVEDLNGVAATGFAGTVTLSTTDAGTGVNVPVPYTFVAGDAGHHQFSFTLTTLGGQTLTASSPGLATTTTPHMVTPTRLTIVATQPSGGSAALNDVALAISALDVAGNPSCTYLTTLTFASSDSQFVGPSGRSTASFAPGCSGTLAQSYSVGVLTVGSWTVTVTDPSSGLAATAGPLVVTTAGLVDHYDLQPAPAVSLGGFRFSVGRSGHVAIGPVYAGDSDVDILRVVALDLWNNNVGTYTSPTPIAFTFAGLAAPRIAGAAGDSCLGGPKVMVTGTPAILLGQPVRITSFPASLTLVTCQAGTETLTATYATAGTPAALATAVDITELGSGAVAATLVPSSLSPTTGTTGITISATPISGPQFLDRYGNLATGQITAQTETLTGYTPVAGCVTTSSAYHPSPGAIVNGVLTAPAAVWFAATGTHVITFALEDHQSHFTGALAPLTLTVTPGAAAKLIIQPQSAAIRSGGTFPANLSVFEVDALDNFCNLATGYSGPVTLTSSDPLWTHSATPAAAAATPVRFTTAMSNGRYLEGPAQPGGPNLEYLFTVTPAGTPTYLNADAPGLNQGRATVTVAALVLTSGFSGPVPVLQVGQPGLTVRPPGQGPVAPAAQAVVRKRRRLQELIERADDEPMKL